MTFEISLPILFVLFEWPSGFCFPCCLGCQLLFSGFHPLFLFCCVIALVVPGVHFLRARLQSSLLLELLLFLCIGIMGPSPASICLAELWLPRMFAIKLTNLDSFEILKLVCLYGQLEKECKTRMEAYFNWYVETSKNIIRYTLLLPLEKLTIISKGFPNWKNPLGLLKAHSLSLWILSAPSCTSECLPPCSPPCYPFLSELLFYDGELGLLQKEIMHPMA